MNRRTLAYFAPSLLCLSTLAACGGGEGSTSSSSSGGDSTGSGGGAPAAAPAVILDMDADYDDIAALAYLCQEHKLGRVELKAVTVTAAGAGKPGNAIKHARCVLEACGLPTIPVADSTATGKNKFPDAFQSDVATTLDAILSTCTQSEAPSAKSAPALINDVAAEAGKITVIMSGPVTNLSLALKEPGGDTLKASIEGVFIMGGAVHVGGNLCCGAEAGFSGAQEFNIWADPDAAETIFQTLGEAVRLVPLDATQFVPVTPAYVDRIMGDHQTKEADLVAAIATSPSMTASVESGDMFWWDPLTAVAAVHPGLVKFTTEGVSVLQEGMDAGQTKPAAAGAKVQVGLDADQAGFEERFLDTLNGKKSD